MSPRVKTGPVLQVWDGLKGEGLCHFEELLPRLVSAPQSRRGWVQQLWDTRLFAPSPPCYSHLTSSPGSRERAVWRMPARPMWGSPAPCDPPERGPRPPGEEPEGQLSAAGRWRRSRHQPLPGGGPAGREPWLRCADQWVINGGWGGVVRRPGAAKTPPTPRVLCSAFVTLFKSPCLHEASAHSPRKGSASLACAAHRSWHTAQS